MGASNSTRKITLVNDEKAGVIKLSESLAHRLRGQIENDRGSERGIYESPSQPPSIPQYPLPPTPEPTPPPPSYIEQPTQIPVGSDSGPQVAQNEGAKLDQNGESIPAWSAYAKEAHLMAARLREEKQLELGLKDEEWRKRMEEREKEYTNMAQLTQTHMQNTIKEVESLFMKVSCSPVCQDQQHNVMKCYRDNANQSLRCADEVESFARCVDLSRLQSFMKEKSS